MNALPHAIAHALPHGVLHAPLATSVHASRRDLADHTTPHHKGADRLFGSRLVVDVETRSKNVTYVTRRDSANVLALDARRKENR